MLQHCQTDVALCSLLTSSVYAKDWPVTYMLKSPVAVALIPLISGASAPFGVYPHPKVWGTICL